MKIPFSASIEISEGVLFRELAGEAVILNLNSEHYFGLDDVGTRIWQEISSSPSIQKAFDKLLAEYNVDRATLQKDFNELINRLIEQGLIRLSHEQSA